MTTNAPITKMEILMPRGFMIFRFCLKICLYSQLIEFRDHFLILFLHCLKTRSLIHRCTVSILCIVAPLKSKGWWVNFGKCESASHNWSGPYSALQCQNCFELQLYFSSPWLEAQCNLGMKPATEGGRWCLPQQPPKKAKCLCWSLLHQEAAAEGYAEPTGCCQPQSAALQGEVSFQ